MPDIVLKIYFERINSIRIAGVAEREVKSHGCQRNTRKDR